MALNANKRVSQSYFNILNILKGNMPRFGVLRFLNETEKVIFLKLYREMDIYNLKWILKLKCTHSRKNIQSKTFSKWPLFYLIFKALNFLEEPISFVAGQRHHVHWRKIQWMFLSLSAAVSFMLLAVSIYFVDIDNRHIFKLLFNYFVT